MDLYLISAALLIDRTTVMITKADKALPGFLPWDPTKRVSPEWAVAPLGRKGTERFLAFSMGF